MKCDSLYQEFKKFEGQPVRIYTDDGRIHCGIDLAAYEDSVRILDKCNRPILIDYTHIDAVLEPQMKLFKACNDEECGCCGDDDDDNGSGRGGKRS